MSNFRYILDPGSKKYKCPKCGKPSLVIFIDAETGELMNDFGRCDRESKCGHVRHPAKHGLSNRTVFPGYNEVVVSPSFHRKDLVAESMKTNNNLLKYLRFLFGNVKVKEIQKKYKIGTLPDFNYGTVFWQIDELNQVRGGKVIQYFDNGKRTKYITWMHQYLIKKKEIASFHLSQCLFGLHLIGENNDSVIALVESEKTACIMSGIFPEFIWMACGAKGEFKMKKIEPIKHRKILAYPDCEIQNNGTTTFHEWNNKAKEFNQKGFDITVSDLLEKESTVEEKKMGIDIADFFMR